MTRVLDASAIASIVKSSGLENLYDMAIARLEAVLRQHNERSVEMKERDGFVLTRPHHGLLEWMPALRLGHTVIVKIVGYHPHNPSKYRLPTILSTMCLLDAATGHLRLVIDGTFATAVRTGAASAIASRLLADPQAQTLGLIGCGAQAVTQLHALSRVFPLERVLVCDIDTTAEDSFAARSRSRGGLVHAVTRAEVERQSDIICTATSVAPGDGPVITGESVKPQVHINSVGSDMPGKTELPRDLLRESVVCPDHRRQAIREGECQQLEEHEIGPSLFDLVNDPAKAVPLRQRRTVYDSTGLALQDLAIAELFEELAVTLEAGTAMRIEASSTDPQDPYAFLQDSWAPPREGSGI